MVRLPFMVFNAGGALMGQAPDAIGAATIASAYGVGSHVQHSDAPGVILWTEGGVDGYARGGEHRAARMIEDRFRASLPPVFGSRI